MACNKENAPDLFSSTGANASITKKVEPFHQLFIQDEFDVELIQDSQFSVEISGGKNLLDKIDAQVTDGKLVLRNKNKFNWVRKMGQRFTLKVHCGVFDYIEINGDGTIITKDTLKDLKNRIELVHNGTNNLSINLKYDWITFRCTNIGKLTVNGACGILAGSVEEASAFDGTYLSAKDAYFYSYSLSDSYIQADIILGINLYGRGNVYYFKEPSISKNLNVQGTGKVILR